MLPIFKYRRLWTLGLTVHVSDTYLYLNDLVPDEYERLLLESNHMDMQIPGLYKGSRKYLQFWQKQHTNKILQKGYVFILTNLQNMWKVTFQHYAKYQYWYGKNIT